MKQERLRPILRALAKLCILNETAKDVTALARAGRTDW